MRTSTCSTCPASVIWVLTENGARMPVDAQPVLAGNLILDTTLDPPRAKYLRITERNERARDAQAIGLEALFYISHFVTCPQAIEHRRKAKERATR